MKRLNKMFFALIPCFLLIFVTGTSQGGVVNLTWSGTVTAYARAGGVSNSDTGTYLVHASAIDLSPPPPWLPSLADVFASISDGEAAEVYASIKGNFTPWTDGTFSIEGAFIIGSSPEFPTGTPLDLTFSGNNYYGAVIHLSRNGNVIWDKNDQFTDSLQVFAGETLILDSGGSMGGEGEDISFEVTPEPATLLLLGLGAVIIRKRRA